ncbi:altronate dehydratase [Haloferax sp. Atlit-47N]|uniref:UxaA family hydrolase n=1 Tax=Haloferax sp. Atlit-48N TaxID=2077198 RepID=A0ACD5I204_9EURY|nr:MULTISPECIES: UxaA family hydrolase [unclassified Haloferax]RDZ31104.1 altronate dehydratase [Haloferax sp. Atlit-48N]RDZ38266.1 altronate dehydratase [Haloferax sp. Atlit-47N]
MTENRLTDRPDRPDRTGRDSFSGSRRPDGRLGIRDRVLVLPSVICSHVVAEEIAARSPGAVAAPHDHGCGQLGADAEQTERTLVGLAGNPNVAGTVVVGLGCETVRSDAVAAAVEERGLPVRELTIQDAGGTDACVDRGAAAVADLRESAAPQEPAEADDSTAAADDSAATLGDLTVGVVVDDLADSTRRHAHPLVAAFVERVAAAGGRVVVAGNERFAAHPEETRALVGGAAADRLLDAAGRPARATRVGTEAATRGFDAATGFLGDAPVTGVVAYGERVGAGHDRGDVDAANGTNADGGVTILDAPSRVEEAATGLAAAGAHLILHVTGQGTPAGHPVVPVVKLSGDADTLAAVPDDIDLDAREADADDLESLLLAVADGDRACAERHGLTEFAIARAGPST